MMFDRLMAFLDRYRRKEQPAAVNDGGDPEKERANRDLDRRLNEARRSNDMIQGIVDTIQQDRT